MLYRRSFLGTYAATVAARDAAAASSQVLRIAGLHTVHDGSRIS